VFACVAPVASPLKSIRVPLPIMMRNWARLIEQSCFPGAVAKSVSTTVTAIGEALIDSRRIPPNRRANQRRDYPAVRPRDEARKVSLEFFAAKAHALAPLSSKTIAHLPLVLDIAKG